MSEKRLNQLHFTREALHRLMASRWDMIFQAISEGSTETKSTRMRGLRVAEAKTSWGQEHRLKKPSRATFLHGSGRLRKRVNTWSTFWRFSAERPSKFYNKRDEREYGKKFLFFVWEDVRQRLT